MSAKIKPLKAIAIVIADSYFLRFFKIMSVLRMSRVCACALKTKPLFDGYSKYCPAIATFTGKE